MITLEVKKLNKEGKLPTFGYESDAGRDLYATETKTIYAGTTELIKTNIALQTKFSSINEEVIPNIPESVKENYNIILDVIDFWYQNHFKHYIKIESRSSLASKKGIHVEAGVIDEEYTGEISVVLANTSKKTYIVRKGDRIGQIIVYAIPEIKEIVEVSEFEKDTDRGSSGFGSTGK